MMLCARVQGTHTHTVFVVQVFRRKVKRTPKSIHVCALALLGGPTLLVFPVIPHFK